jgi:hypothetical protein
MPDSRTTFEDLRERFPWRPLRGCPGRYVMAGAARAASPRELFGPLAFHETSSARAPDRIIVAEVEGGGIISYAKPDGTFVHTLGDSAGFRRKLAALGLQLD